MKTYKRNSSKQQGGAYNKKQSNDWLPFHCAFPEASNREVGDECAERRNPRYQQTQRRHTTSFGDAFVQALSRDPQVLREYNKSHQKPRNRRYQPADPAHIEDIRRQAQNPKPPTPHPQQPRYQPQPPQPPPARPPRPQPRYPPQHLRYFQTLELQPTTVWSEIKAQYNILAKQWHPDKNKSNTEVAKARFLAIHEAYKALEKNYKKGGRRSIRKRKNTNK